jgi:hypothetical protein
VEWACRLEVEFCDVALGPGSIAEPGSGGGGLAASGSGASLAANKSGGSLHTSGPSNLPASRLFDLPVSESSYLSSSGLYASLGIRSS